MAGWQGTSFEDLCSKFCTGQNEGITDPPVGAHSINKLSWLGLLCCQLCPYTCRTWWESWALSKVLTKKILFLGAKLIGPNGHLYVHNLTRGTNQAKKVSIF